jgi:YidC/Oxa1 family membrane protein insertase
MPERSSSTPSLGNILAFAAVFLLAMVVYPMIMAKLNPPPPQAANAPAANEKKGDEKKDDKAVAQRKAEAEKKANLQNQPMPSDEPVDQSIPANAAKPKVANKPAAPQDKDSPLYSTLGSLNPSTDNPYRMGATFSRKGGALMRLELSSERYRDLDDRSGYLGHLVMDDTDKGPGCLVQAVVDGTPAAKAGIKPGDRIMSVTCRNTTTIIGSPEGLEAALRLTEPKDTIELKVRRQGQNKNEEQLTATLIRRPLEVIRPERKMPNIVWIRNGPLDAIHLEENCPASFLTSLQQVDDEKLRADEDPAAKFNEELSRELAGGELRDALWDRVPVKPGEEAYKVVFRCRVPRYPIEITKTYELQKAGNGADDAGAYHLVLNVSITNLDDAKKHDVAFRQDGPNGLPVEGAWYVSYKVSRKWGATEGLRDIDYEFAGGGDVDVVSCSELAEKGEQGLKYRRDIGDSTVFEKYPPRFFAVDAQYFSVAMLPDAKSTAPNIDRAIALRTGDVEEQRKTLTNTTFRLLSKPLSLAPGATSELQQYKVFAGPKQPTLLANSQYQLSGLIYYGWPIFQKTAEPLTWVLEHFYKLVRNYGLAIIMLTIVVRLALLPLSRKQTMNAVRMQQMQQKMAPEMKELEKKYKKDAQALNKAKMELWQKHGLNPYSSLGGCLPLLIQMPIFIGLYRALQVDVELRDAPLIADTVRWCSNLAAPDMLFDWSRFMPNAVNNGIGFPGFPLIGSALGLGPYLNLFPIITIALYLIQQKVMMPPATDEQTAAQQKMMKYMMIVFGLFFYKVAAGLCLYFISTTLWGLAEKRFLPKPVPAGGDGADAPVDVKSKQIKPRLTDSEREAVRRQKRKK